MMRIIKEIQNDPQNRSPYKQKVYELIHQAMSCYADAILACVKESSLEVIRIPCYSIGYATFPHELKYGFSMKKVREEAEKWLYNYFRKEGFSVTVKLIKTDDDDYGTEYWRSLKIKWNASNKANMQRSKRPVRSRKQKRL